MSIPSFSETEVKTFIQDWFKKLDSHPNQVEMLPLVSDKVIMKMPDRKESFENHEGFIEWFRGVEQFRDQSHTVKALWIVIDSEIATVKLINRWQRTDSRAANPSEVLVYYAAQTWTLQPLPHTGKLVIITYTVDYFLPEI